jgi:hypothetical protein
MCLEFGTMMEEQEKVLILQGIALTLITDEAFPDHIRSGNGLCRRVRPDFRSA